MILVYTRTITSRVSYIFKQIFVEFLGIEVTFTSNKEDFISSEKIKINYSENNFGEGIYFKPVSLLFENGISYQTLSFESYKNKPSFFNIGEESCMPFDVFAASFYLLSRYEEYLPHKRDLYDRFPATESIAFQKDFLQEPLINIWTLELLKILKKHYPDFNYKEKQYNYINTIDIDNAYAFKHKGLIRTIGGYGRSLINMNFKEIKKRFEVLRGTKKDPYDTYNFLKKTHDTYSLDSIYFFLLGDYGLNDKNISPYNNFFQLLIKDISDYANVGIHPSFNSNSQFEILDKEKRRLEDIVKQEVTRSRQHFLKINLPKTYQTLSELDIKEDYSMGYADHLGFRASVSSPFYFYNLDIEKQTGLKIFPFIIMEATLKYYLKLTPTQALSEIKLIIDKIKSVNGTFISLWHNETLCDEGIWKGWRMVYENMINYAKK